MENFTNILFCVLIIGIFMYYILKGICVNKITKAIKHNENSKVIQLSKQKLTKRFMGDYVCTLYRLRAYSNLGNEKNFKKEVDATLEKKFSFEQRKNFLEMYFHYFLLKGDRDYSEKLLNEIQELGEPSFLAYNEQAFEVMLNHRTDYIDVLDAEINSKKHSGFALGVMVYLIGEQYLTLGNKEEARVYYYNSISCFHKSAVYVIPAKKHVQELSNELELDLPNY
ncbi:hypothetical protein ACWG0P_01145 [Amedibacillus sp. YH-ame6]